LISCIKFVMVGATSWIWSFNPLKGIVQTSSN
jgi:hypothetical protein